MRPTRTAPQRAQAPAKAAQRQPGLIGTLSFLWEKSHALCIALAIALVLALGWAFDAIATYGRIYQGVSVGEVDVSGMTVDEAAAALDARYGTALAATTVFIFGSQETADTADIDELMIQQDAIAEQISYEEAESSRTMWMANAETLDAYFPAHALADEALQVGRDGHLFDRIAAGTSGWDIAPRIAFDDAKLESMIENIDATLGELRVDWGIKVEDGVASVTEGHDGEMMDSARFVEKLTHDLLVDQSDRLKMVAQIEYAPIRIDEQQAQVVCDAINSAIAEGASFTYDGSDLDADRVMVGEWVATEVTGEDGSWKLSPYLDPTDASQSIAAALTEGEMGSTVGVRFEVDGDDVTVVPDSAVVIPSAGTAVAELDETLFGIFRETGELEIGEMRFGIPIQAETTHGPFTFDEALADGVISRIATFTTSYNDTASTQNRKFNIHRAADSLNDTIITRDGGTWSFNEYAGSCDEASGYKPANAIVEGEVVAEPGGGICQVATTVFNAVYESGFPIDERHNHTLRMNSYPDGRDAAIAYPRLDLRWTNDSDSDVLMRTSYSETTVTVSLYGVPLGYVVETETGDWEESERYKVKLEVDEEKPSDYSKVKTVGTDGMEIYVIRTVTDANGEVVREDRFDSLYSPVDKVIVVGPDTTIDIEDRQVVRKTKSSKSS